MNNNNKQQRVRVLQTGELGTVTDQVLMKRGNKPMVYKQVRLDSKPDQLGDTRETCRITLAGGDGTELYIKVTHDYEKYGSYEFEAFGKPANLKEHDRHGLPFLLTGALLKGLGVGQEGVETSVDVRPAISEKN